MPVDKEFRARWNAAINKAGRNGWDLVETLERDGLLATPDWKHNVEVQALEDLFRRFDTRSAADLMQFYHGRVEGTPELMFQALGQWLESVIKGIADKTVAR